MKKSLSLVKVLESQLQESDSSNFEVDEQRERNARYFTLQPIGNEQRGRSHYISPDVLDHVESQKALFRETFLSNRQTVKFTSCGQAGPYEAEAKTAYVNAMLNKADKEKLFSDGWHDAFVMKRMVVLAEWKQDTEKREIEVAGPNMEVIYQGLQSIPNIVDVDNSELQFEQVPTPQGPMTMLAGNLQVYTDDSHVKLTLCKPESYYRDPLASCLDEAMWATYEEEVPRGTLIMLGYDEEQVDDLSGDRHWQSDSVDFARKAHDQSHTSDRKRARDDVQETVAVYKTWTWLNLNGIADEHGEWPDEMRLYEIHWSGGEVLMWADGTPAISEADEMPFFEWSEIRISHAEYGMCGADVVAHTQKTQSTLKRLIIDNQQMRNTTRWEAVQGNLKNPRDLLDNAIGGVIWSDQIGSVAPLAAPELSPLTMGVVSLLQQDNDRRSGLSGLAKGMNTDALRYQNADSMIERLTNAGSSRPMGAARDWAHTFLIPLCQYIVRLGRKYDKRVIAREVAGQQIQIAPSTWADNEDQMQVAVALTPQEATEHAQKLLMMHQLMSGDEQLSQLYGVAQRHAMFDDIFDAMGVTDTTRYMMRPDSPEYQQQMMAQQQAMQEQQAKQEQLMALQIQSMDNEQARKWAELNNKIMDTMADNQRADDQFEWDRYVDQKEINIEEDQNRQAAIG